MSNKNLILPKKDKNGKSRLSYSQIKCFKNSKKDFVNRYILNKKFKNNPYVDFGTKIGKSLQNNDFNDFNDLEVDVLKKIERLDKFEEFVSIDFGSFVLYGYIDAISEDKTRIIDYKTGGINKEFFYVSNDYTQLCYYAIGIKQKYNIDIESAEVHFIRRLGNPFKGQPLVVAQEEPLIIETDVSKKRLKSVYDSTIKIAKEIEQFYIYYLNETNIKY